MVIRHPACRYSVGINVFSRPIHYAWDRVRPGIEGHCIRQLTYQISVGSLNVALNLVVFLLVSFEIRDS